MNQSCLHISFPKVVRTDEDMWRVTASVGSREIFFESATPLAPAREALPSAFLLPAMSRGMDLRISGTVCPHWLRNVEEVRTLARKWWSYSGGRILHDGEEDIAPAGGNALFFGGGVDSFFALRRERRCLNHLIYVEGYDVTLPDTERLARIADSNRAIAQQCGLELVTIRTNLRGHPDFRIIYWDNTHGGALAAVGHLLGNICSTVFIAGGVHISQVIPHGSHPNMDRAWSSNAVRFIHHGTDSTRLDKVSAIASWPLVHQHLRVCWEHRKSRLNCGDCEKCVRTQLEFLAEGKLETPATFPAGSLLPRIDRVPRVPPLCIQYYEELLERINDSDIRRSIQALLARSPIRGQARRGRYQLASGILKKLKGQLV
ncbi:MAG: hypothetical protein HQ583_08615 [Candidatus Abyssubacteria bacterium]|nr:hypothetical protein [Candidatus Abyssubacteria bacterium]